MSQKQATAAMVEKYKHQREEYQNMGISLLGEEDPDFLIGCILYWAEGTKRRNSTVFVNSDPYMIKIMISFFRKFFNIPDDKFTIRFNCHLDNDLTYQDIENYWLVISHDNNFLSLSYANYEKLIKLVEKAKNKIKKL